MGASDQSIGDVVLAALPAAVVVVDGVAQIVEANAAAASLLGVAADALRGAPLDRVLPGVDVGARDCATPVEVTAVRGDGRRFRVELARAPVARPGGAFTACVLTDVTARTDAPSRLLEQLPELVLRLSLTGTVVYANRDPDGVARPLAGAHWLRDALPAASDALDGALQRVVTARVTEHVELPLVLASGAVVRHACRIGPFVEDDRLTGVIVVGTDSGATGEAATGAPRRARVLVVDDEPLIARSVVRILCDHDVVVADGGAQALATLRSSEPFDVILCDLSMPQVSGIDVFETLAREDAAHALRIVFMTGGAFTQRARQFLADNRNPRLDKPFDADALRRVVEDVLPRP